MSRELELDAHYCALLGRMGVDPAEYPLRFAPDDENGVHVEPLEGRGWRRYVSERGRIVESRDFPVEAELLYRFACDVAAAEGALWQSARPASRTIDPRRADFAYRLELMGRVSPEWRARLEQELARVIARHPYRDGPATLARRRGRRLVGPGLIAFLLVIVLAAHSPLAPAYIRQDALSRGARTEALITERRIKEGPLTTSYWLDYRFTVDGHTISASEEVDEATWQSAAPDGSRLEVLYRPEDPRDYLLEGQDPFGRLLYIYGVIDAVLLLLAARGWWRFRAEPHD